jgi:protein O-mannosyl-transferase
MARWLAHPVVIALMLAGVTLALYWPVLSHEFINYDDPDYVTENPRVRVGLTRAGLVWAFTQLHGEYTYWHPLTWLSHMLDCELFGLNAGAHHLENVVFHAANVVLLFVVLRQLTRATGRSAIVAALFALHPLQVDTVAWVTERKNVLSTLFFLLTVWAYARYAQVRSLKSKVQCPASAAANPEHATRNTQHASPFVLRPPIFYLLSLYFFALALMSKPVVVTLPCVLLLLDFWPLGRFQPSTLRRLLLEKVPFFVLAAAVSAVTIVAHQRLGSVASLTQMPLTVRLANALVSYARYLKKVCWPNDLAVFYPYPAAWPMEVLVLAVVVLLGISAVVVWRWRVQPYLVVGWCWFVGTLVPTIGLIQAGAQSMADRFAYVPLIGVGLMLVWGGASLLAEAAYRRVTLGVLSIAMLGACLVATRQQLRYWHNSATLFRHEVDVTEGNYIARDCLGDLLYHQGRVEEAIAHFQKALEIQPKYAQAHHHLGCALLAHGRVDEALAHFRKALELRPNHAETHNNLGVVLRQQGQLENATAHFQKALELRPDYAEAHNNFGLALRRQGQPENAIAHFQKALELRPNNAEAHNNLGVALRQQGQLADAMAHFQKAIAIQPDLADAHHNLGLALLESGRAEEAIGQFQQVLAIRPDHAQAKQGLDLARRQQQQVKQSIAP